MSKASDRAYAAIRTQILDGSLAPGAQVTEEDIAALCDTSRTPVREAMRRLEGEKLIERDRQRSYVRVWSDAAMEDVFALRSMLEPYIAERAAHMILPEQRDVLRQTSDIIRHEMRKAVPDISVFVDQNTIFHTTLLEATGSDVLDSVMQRLIVVPIVHQTLRRYTKSQLEKTLLDHDELIVAFEQRDPLWARAIMTNHIFRARSAFFRG